MQTSIRPVPIEHQMAILGKIERAMLTRQGKPYGSAAEPVHIKYGPDVHYGESKKLGKHYAARVGDRIIHFYEDHVYISPIKGGIPGKYIKMHPTVQTRFLEVVSKIPTKTFSDNVQQLDTPEQPNAIESQTNTIGNISVPGSGIKAAEIQKSVNCWLRKYSSARENVKRSEDVSAQDILRNFAPFVVGGGLSGAAAGGLSTLGNPRLTKKDKLRRVLVGGGVGAVTGAAGRAGLNALVHNMDPYYYPTWKEIKNWKNTFKPRHLLPMTYASNTAITPEPGSYPETKYFSDDPLVAAVRRELFARAIGSYAGDKSMLTKLPEKNTFTLNAKDPYAATVGELITDTINDNLFFRDQPLQPGQKTYGMFPVVTNAALERTDNGYRIQDRWDVSINPSDIRLLSDLKKRMLAGDKEARNRYMVELTGVVVRWLADKTVWRNAPKVDMRFSEDKYGNIGLANT